jgi:(p)ppGpp synthase/HD superfamily hydrolase
MSINFTPRLQLAINFAAESHRGQNRKNEMETPYIAHPYSVMLIISEYTDDENVYIGCLLHDTVEDCGVTFLEIESLFGVEIKNIVYHVTEPAFFGSPDNPLSWKEKKENYLALLETGTSEALLVAASDKIHNMSTLSRDLVHKGTFWFLERVLEIFENRKSEMPDDLLNKYKNTLDKIKSEFA